VKKWTINFDDKTKPAVSVAVAVYNKPRELKMCLEGYRRQSCLKNNPAAFELILADDGSSSDIEDIYRKFAGEVSFPCTYLFQEDKGWGKIRMLNAACLEALADRIVFTDGDCVPHRHFARSYAEMMDEDSVYCGRRVDLMGKISAPLSEKDVASGRLDSLCWHLKAVFGGLVDYGEQGFYFPDWLYGLFTLCMAKNRPSILGSNFSIHRKWLKEVNGFDESYHTPGIGEDTDLERRLRMTGVKFRWITHKAIQYHVWHTLTKVGEQSRETHEALKSKGNKEAVKGLKQFNVFRAP